MCVKEFLGYNCGHCSTPYLRLCPVAASNPVYPPCQFPAERPIFTNEDCHPCARVVWNAKVLAEEDAHRELHKREECNCEVMFDAEERERRSRPRPKSKGKGRDYEGNWKDRHQGTAEGMNKGAGRGIEGAPKGPRGYNPATHKGSNPRHGWNVQAQIAAYQYVGYFDGGDRRLAMDQAAQGRGFPASGFVPQESMWPGQAMIGQPGSGMKWYTESTSPIQTLPALPAILEASFSPTLYNDNQIKVRNWQKSISEPVEEKASFLTSPVLSSSTVISDDVEIITEAGEAPVVSSDMAQERSA